MEKLFKLLCMALLVFAINTSWAQQTKVTGTVTDDSGEAIPGVFIVVKGT